MKRIGMLLAVLAVAVLALGCNMEGEAIAGTIDRPEQAQAAEPAVPEAAEADVFTPGECAGPDGWDGEEAYGCGGGCGGGCGDKKAKGSCGGHGGDGF
jgi:hypothetical protein